MAKTASSIIKTAKSYKGKNGTIFQKAYGVSKGTAWCGIFVWFIFEKCGASDLFLARKKNPAYVPNIDKWGKEKKLTVNKSKAKKGDIVIFDWGNDGTKDHVGFIIENKGNGIYQTIEGNTSGGKVAIKTRYKKDIATIIRPKYESEKYNLKRKLKKGCIGSDVKKLQSKLKVKQDGSFGNDTYKALVKYQKSKGWKPSGVVRKKTAHSFGWLYKGK